MTESAPRFVDTPEDLERLAAELAGEPLLAIDTEFIRERTNVPRLELVQIAVRSGAVAIVDYGTLGRVDGDPLAARLGDRAVQKVLHAADQDLEMLAPLTGAVPEPVWDTQLVAGLFGYGGRIGYAAMVESLLGARPRSGEALTDWSKRPLDPQQLAYAAEDVRYLIPLYDLQRERLEQLGRLGWAEEECARLLRRAREVVASRVGEPHERVRGWQRLSRRGVAILRELAAWRTEQAKRRDRPEVTVMRDDLLVEVARRAPVDVEDLRRLRGIDGRVLDRHAAALVEAVRAGKAVPDHELPAPAPRKVELGEAEQSLVSLLRAALHGVALEAGVLPSLLATGPDVERAVAVRTQGRPDAEARLLDGWRAEIASETVRGVLEGRLGVVWNPSKRRLEVRALGGG